MQEQRKHGPWALIFTHRMGAWLWISVALLVAIYFLARHQIGVAIYKLALITIGGYVGYVLSLALEGTLGFAGKRRFRPHELQAFGHACRKEAGAKTVAARAELLEHAWQYELAAIHMLWRRAMTVGFVLVAAAMGG